VTSGSLSPNFMLKVSSLRALSLDLPAYPSLRQKNSAPQEQFAFEKEKELTDRALKLANIGKPKSKTASGDVDENQHFSVPDSSFRTALSIAEEQTPTCLAISAMEIPISVLKGVQMDITGKLQ
jgi:hypothetical protein